VNARGELADYFDECFADFERNRMYPLGYGKEHRMVKMTMQHISALSHAELFLEPAIENAPEARYATRLTQDLERLSEVKAFVLDNIVRPKLPWEP